MADETMENNPMITQNWHEQYQRQLADNIKLNDALAEEHALKRESENLLRELMTQIHTINLDMDSNYLVTKIKAWLAEH